MFEEETVVWLPDGRECSYVCAAGNGHVVWAHLEHEEGGAPGFGGKEYVDHVLSSPPRHKLDRATTEAQERLDALRQEVSEAQQEHRQVEEMKETALKALSELKALQHIQDFIGGKITHFLGTTYGARLLTFQEAMGTKEDEYGRRPGETKLLSLFGRSGGDLSWRINTYYDGSGSWTEWLPFLSYEDAKAGLAEHASSRFTEYLSGGRASYTEKWAAECNKHCVPVPQNVLDKLESKRTRCIEDNIGTHEKAISELRGKLVG